MVYKIRNKSFFFTMSGYKNNYHVKVLNDPAEARPDQTYALKTWEGGPQFVRFHQMYRNMSRKCKQYLYGNKELEENVVIWLKEHFRIPMTCETPIHLIQVETERRFANQGDRDYELLSNNQHPYQLHFYREVNASLREELESQELREAGEKPLEDQAVEVMEAHLKAAAARKGGPVSAQELREIFSQVHTLYKAAQGARHTRTPSGEFNDFLEVRRPFADPAAVNANVKTE